MSLAPRTKKLPPWPYPYTWEQIKRYGFTRARILEQRRFARERALVRSWYREVQVLCPPGDQAAAFSNLLMAEHVPYMIGGALSDGTPVIMFSFPIHYPISEPAFNRLQQILQRLATPKERLKTPGQGAEAAS